MPSALAKKISLRITTSLGTEFNYLAASRVLFTKGHLLKKAENASCHLEFSRKKFNLFRYSELFRLFTTEIQYCSAV